MQVKYGDTVFLAVIVSLAAHLNDKATGKQMLEGENWWP